MRVLVAPAFVLFAASCHDGSRRTTTSTTPPATGLRAAGDETAGGHSDFLAAQFLLTTGTPIQHGGRATFMVRDPQLERRLTFHAMAHLEASALGTGVFGGAALEGAARTRRLAAAPDAPADRNGNGSNLDEVAADEVAQLANLAGADAPRAAYGAMLPWRAATATLAGPVAGRDAFDGLRVTFAPLARNQIDAAQIGGAMLARVHAAARLLETSRGSRPGADPRGGALGLLLMQQVVAAEETLLAALFGRDGTLSGLRDPRTYDPRSPSEAVFVPARVQAALEPALPGAPAAYSVVDRASSLLGLSALLEAAAELAWLASMRNANVTLRDVLNGFPFGVAPDRRRGRGGLAARGGEEVTFTRDVSPILDSNCLVCHNDGSRTNDFSMGTFFPVRAVQYEKVLTPGLVGRLGNPPHVTSGDHNRSLLWIVLDRGVPGVNRMPRGCGNEFFPCLPSGQISLVADWIDQGLRREPSVPPPPPEIGADLARALLRNLAVLHADSDGALADRHDGDVRGRVVSAQATGAALSALATAVMALPPDADGRALLQRAATFAARTLVTAPGEVFAELVTDAASVRKPSEPADAVQHAALAAGLFVAARVLDDDEVRTRARAAAGAWLQTFWRNELALFRLRAGDDSLQVDAFGLSFVLRALQEAAADGAVASAGAAHDALLANLLPALVASEWDGLGEVLDDGNPDTDGNGIAEPALAGGTFGRAPLLLGTLRFGPDPVIAPAPVSFAELVLPLFRSACVGCHVDGAVLGGYRLDTPAMAARAGESGMVGRVIVPGDPEASLLYRKLVDRQPPVGQQMPLQRPPLDARGVELVRRWIAEGALDR
jgi:hypothetical protein